MICGAPFGENQSRADIFFSSSRSFLSETRTRSTFTGFRLFTSGETRKVTWRVDLPDAPGMRERTAFGTLTFGQPVRDISRAKPPTESKNERKKVQFFPMFD